LDRTDEFRMRAAECLELAHRSQNMEDQARWLEMALFWAKLAQRALEQQQAAEARPPATKTPSDDPAA
jgi:hypothetical protein